MKTAKEFDNYITTNKFGTGMTKGWNLKHLNVIQETLNENEEVHMLFIGLHNYISATKHNNNFAYALTNDRIIMGQKKLFGETSISVYLNQLNDVTYSSGMVWAKITVDTLKETFNVGINKDTGKRIFNELQKGLAQVRNKQPNIDNIQTNTTDELLKLKGLLDSGLLTIDEFNIQKNRILLHNLHNQKPD